MHAGDESQIDHREVRELFHQVLDHRESGNEDQAELALQSASPPLRAAVEKLLQAHRRASGVLLDDSCDASGYGTLDQVTAEESVPSIPGYDIFEEIGRGGFGIVYRARQRTPIDRPVAIKVLRHELVSPQVIARFKTESVLLARMSHDSIAKVYDAGMTQQGQPFVTMELIEAKPLIVACNEYGLGTHDRIELMAHVCDAVQHAHQRAVIHRDLKPANILVEKHPDGYRPRVIDFGIAKLLDADPASPHTQASVRLGTPRYMSPEQRDGTNAADTRVDVYALGALLCELLAGDVPEPTDSERKQQSGAPGNSRREELDDSRVTKPSRIASELGTRSCVHPRILRGDLDRIVLKACAIDPDLRYASAQALADDLRNYLAGRPINATPPGVLYVSRKFIRRHRASVSLAGVLGVALLVSMGVAALKWREASLERDRAWASTERVAFIGDFMLDMLLLTADSNARGAPPILTEDAMQAIADRAADGLADDPQHMLPMLEGIGRFQTQSGYAEMGTQSVRRALDFAVTHHGSPSPEVVELRLRLHDLLWGHGLDGWKEQIQLADSESAALFDDEDPRRLRVVQRSDGSIENLKRIIALYDTMPDIDPSDRYHALFALSMQQRFSPNPSDQLETCRKLYEVAQQYYPPEHNAIIDSMALYGDALTVYAPSEEAVVLLNTAYERSIRVFGYDHFTTESIRRGVARIYGKLGRPEEGIPYAIADLESVERSRGSDSIQYANALFELGRLYQYAGQLELARDTLLPALALKSSKWPRGHAQITSTQIVLAQVMIALGELDQAEDLAVQAIEFLTTRRDAQNYASAMRVRIAIREQNRDEFGKEELLNRAVEQLSGYGFSQVEIDGMLGG